MKYYIQLLFTPGLWKTRRIYSKTWDNAIRLAIKEGDKIAFEVGNNFGQYNYIERFKIGELTLDLDLCNWHSFGNSTSEGLIFPPNADCGRITKLMLKEYLEKHCKSLYDQKFSPLYKAMK